MENYKKLLEKAQKAYKNCVTGAEKRRLESIFPELKESEDEQIRKEIQSVIKQLDKDTTICGNKYDYSQWIAWLEKQGEKESDPRYENLEEILAADDIYQMSMNDEMVQEAKEKAVNALSGMCIGRLLGLEKQGKQKSTKNIMNVWKDMRLEVYQQASGNRHEPNYSDDTTKMFSLNDIDEIIEKVSDQKPVDKAQPKFKVGDWVVYSTGEWREVLMVETVDGNGYGMINKACEHISIGFEEEIYMRLWRISDARAGDVLASEHFISVFKEFKGNVSFSDYVTYSTDSCILFRGLTTFKGDAFKPATVEQRRALKDKFEKEGLVWDGFKMELMRKCL